MYRGKKCKRGCNTPPITLFEGPVHMFFFSEFFIKIQKKKCKISGIM